MPTPDPTQLDRIEATVDQILAAISPGGPPPPPPAALQPPANFTATLNADRSVTDHWTDAPGADAVEIHEFETDPANTLKATVPAGTQTRTSSVLKGGHNYTFAGRSRAGSAVSEFTPRITLAVPAQGGGSTPPPPTGTGKFPSDVLDLTDWTVMLPTGAQGSPDNGYLIGRSIPDVCFVGADGGVVFKANAGGVHSPGSKFCRTECRQMADPHWTKADWPSTGDHTLECDLAIDASGLVKRKRVVGMQIHDAVSDVCQIMRHETNGLGLIHNNGKTWESLDPHYVDGTRFTCKIHAVADTIQVWYNGALKVTVPKVGTSWYWKMGCYLQSDVPTYGEAPDATGQVVIYRYALTGGAS